MFNFPFKRKKYTLGYFCTAIVWHCNLNCCYCDHFAPLAQEKFLGIKKLEKDFKQVAKYIDIKNIGLMGGEPLLHPNINNILIMTRKIFPSTMLTIYTNGILLDKMEEEFWRICHSNRIVIRITKYKINIQEESIFKKARKYGVWTEYFGSSDGEYKKMYKMALDLDGSQDKAEMHKICWQNKGSCNYFEDGKLYQCAIVGNIKHFNNYFHKNLEITKNDYVDLYKIKNTEEIAEYFDSKLDFCKYCDIKSHVGDLEIKVSKKDISDWCK